MVRYHQPPPELGAVGLAARPSGVYAQLVAELRQRGIASGIHLLSLRPTPTGDGDPSAFLYMRDGDPDAVRAGLPAAVEQLHAELRLPDLFASTRRAMCVEHVVGWQRWLRSDVYQQHFRPVHSARQLVVGLTDAAGAPRAFMAVSRGESEVAMSLADEATILGLRDAAQRALVPFDVTEDWSRPADAILGDLAAALPIPAVLLDAAGNVTWMNGEAEIRLGLVAYAFGSSRLYGGASEHIAELADWVRLELDHPGAALERAAIRRPAWLAPEEHLVVKRLGAEPTPRVLVCIHVPRPPPDANPSLPATDGLGLSGREGEVALLAARGFTALNIAAHLNVAESTVKTHLKRVYRKLGVFSRVELTRTLFNRPV